MLPKNKNKNDRLGLVTDDDSVAVQNTINPINVVDVIVLCVLLLVLTVSPRCTDYNCNCIILD